MLAEVNAIFIRHLNVKEKYIRLMHPELPEKV
jgi:hypothetical protein